MQFHRLKQRLLFLIGVANETHAIGASNSVEHFPFRYESRSNGCKDYANKILAVLIVLVAYFLINAAIMNALLKRPDGSQMGFGKAALVTLVALIIQIVLGVILVFVFGAGIMAMIGMGAASAVH